MGWTPEQLEEWYSTAAGTRAAGEVCAALAAMSTLQWVGGLKPAVLTVGFAHPFVKVWPTASVDEADWHDAKTECRYDRILVSHVLEFADEPGEVLAKCWQALRPDGVLAVLVPNQLSLWRWKKNAPFAAGASYGFGEVHALLVEEGFRPMERGYAVACPVGGRLSHKLCPNFGGLVLMTARKEVAGMRAMKRDAVTGKVSAVPVGVATLRGN